MLEIKGYHVYLTRGDYAEITIGVTNKDDKTPHIFEDGETVTFRIGGCQKFEKECVVHEGESDVMLILTEEDTKDFLIGTHPYEFEYRDTSNRPDTFIADKPFTITPEQEEHNG